MDVPLAKFCVAFSKATVPFAGIGAAVRIILGRWIESGCGWGVNGTLDGCLAGMVESMVGERWLLVAVSGMMKKFGEGVLGK